MHLHHWIANPTIPCDLWPRALKLAQLAGQDILFEGLHTSLQGGLASSDLVRRKRKGSPVKRKRKRPHCCDQSAYDVYRRFFNGDD